MNKLNLILAMALTSGGAYAQGTGVTTSTDPAKAAAVEAHAQELQARQSKEATQPMATPADTHKAKDKTSGKHASTHQSSTHKSSTHKSQHKSSQHKSATAPKS